MAEGTPLERVQVVNSGARVQIPPSPLDGISRPQQLFKSTIELMFRMQIQSIGSKCQFGAIVQNVDSER